MNISQNVTPADIANLRLLRGKNVTIRWRNPDDDWYWFKLYNISDAKRMVLVQGVGAPDGRPHDGDRFWTMIADIETIEEAKS